MSNKKNTISIFGAMLRRIWDRPFNRMSRAYLLNHKIGRRNAETFYLNNLIKLGYLEECSEGYYVLKRNIPWDYNTMKLREEMKEKKKFNKNLTFLFFVLKFFYICIENLIKI